MKYLQDSINLKDKKVLLRVDFNVSLEKGKIKDKFKIEAAKESLDFLLDQGAKVAMLSHFGRPTHNVSHNEAGRLEGFQKEFSLSQIQNEVADILGREIVFVPDCLGEKVSQALDDNNLLLLENVRFYSGEEENSEEFAKKLSENFDIFVNDAFSVCHRNQASVTGVTKFLESYAGRNLQKEVVELSHIRKDFARPAVAVIGGAKIETKLPVINFFKDIYDFVLVGGKVANEALDSKEDFGEKVLLPVDFVDDRLDIGSDTIARFKKIIEEAKTIVWNGPMGKFEEERYASGTEEIYQAIVENQEAVKVTGGGETLEILEKKNSFDKFTFVSTGGGAMLEYITKGTLPGLEVLK